MELQGRLFPNIRLDVVSRDSGCGLGACRLFGPFKLTARSTFIWSESSGSCQTPGRKLTGGAALPSSSPSTTRSHAKRLRDAAAAARFLFILFVLSGHLQICFSRSPPPPRLSGPRTCARQKPPNYAERRRKYAISSAHPPQAAIVWEEARRRCVSRRGEHVCMCVICVRVPAAQPGEQSFQWESGLGSGSGRLHSSLPHSRFSALLICGSCRRHKSLISIAQSVRTGQS